MSVFGVLGFTTPWLLLGLLVLPILWVLLRAVPPAPIRRRFPGVALLMGLSDDQVETDKTPWWLLVLRAMVVAGLIVGFSGPILTPRAPSGATGPLLVIMDGGWASAPDWRIRQDKALEIVDQAGRAGRQVAFIQLTSSDDNPVFGSYQLAARQIRSATPAAWLPQPPQLALTDDAETYWLAGAVAWQGAEQLLDDLLSLGPVTVYETGRVGYALKPVTLTDDGIGVTALRNVATDEVSMTVHALGLDPSGVERVLGAATATFDVGATESETVLNVPVEIRNRITRVAFSSVRTAASVTLTGDRLQRREIALISDQVGGQEAMALLSPLHYLRQALVGSADLIDGTLTDVLQASPDAIIMADVADISARDALIDWVEKGGTLVRFAGPRTAAADFTAMDDDPLMPVRLRSGGRAIGGAMSWGAPKTLHPFAADTPFFGLPVPAEVTVTAQVLAEPGPNLADRVIARLTDGTPLVTRRALGQGQIVLFHVTANAEWSNLPLSGLFMAMLERLSVLETTAVLDEAALADTTWQLSEVLDAYGTLKSAGDMPGIDGADLVAAPLSADAPPGLYRGQHGSMARNVIDGDDVLAAHRWPAQVRREGLDQKGPIPLMHWVLIAALILMMFDTVASLGLSGKLRGPIVTMFALCLFSTVKPNPVLAQTDIDRALYASGAVVLAYVVTGDDVQDKTSLAGMKGLSMTLYRRTSIEPIAPVGVDLAADELAFFPFLYWPITLNQKPPSADVVAKLNRYIKGGGMIMFDTRDAELSQYGRSTEEGRLLQQIAAGLNIPPIAPIPEDHVLTRTFYLLQEFPGRHSGGTLWVESVRGDATQVEGLPFRRLNDGVTPVVIGGNDWAAAWAINESRQPLLPVGRGFAGERQREIANRFGVNLIMHVLTGNYKSDQVHVPALLDRLGQE